MNNDQIFFQDQSGVEGTSEIFDTFGESLAAGDFDGDTKVDLAIGVPGEAIGNITDTGAVNVLQGSDNGLTVDNDQIWFQDQPGVEGTSESNDGFGRSLTTGDFNGDGKKDLAIGIPFEDIGDIVRAGAVNILNGSDNGLTSQNSQIWFQDQSGVEDTSESGDQFGWSLAAGDFNADGFDDLAVGVFDESIGDVIGAGAVNILNGSESGLTAQNSQIWFQDQLGVEDTSEEFDRFGTSLAVGDYNGDGFDDLAVGAIGEDIGDFGSAGAVNIINGSDNGLTAQNSQIWFQDQPGVEDTSEGGDQFGGDLAAGDFNGDGFDDLAIGVSSETIGSIFGAGAVNILNGSDNGLTADNDQILFQDILGIEGTSEAFDGFGASLATGDFNGDGFDDLAVGVFGEAIGDIGAGGDINGAGAVNVLNGSANGLTVDNDQIWFQDQPGVEGTSESGDLFGSSLSVGDFNGDGFDDLAIGVPFEDIGDIQSAGATNILFGSVDGLMA